ncbi:unnamed protein product [Caenorhabditis auriculariae]|uniref:Uncharacterized protein n=1 Tax=Caenorhabditis auriculariae TaxID=2777116 RepID=A0A8S1H589_9PELO|nr:unnamed protein product [Caenorhabditis auriculariae]
MLNLELKFIKKELLNVSVQDEQSVPEKLVLGSPYVETRERGVQAADKAEEEKEKEKLELLKREKEEKERRLEAATAENASLTANLARSSLELQASLGIEEELRQENCFLRAQLEEANEARRRLAAQLEAALGALDIPVEPEMAEEVPPEEDPQDQGALLLAPQVDRRRRSSSEGSQRSSKRSREEEPATPGDSPRSRDVFLTPERGVEHARDGPDVMSGQEDEGEDGEQLMEEEDEIVPESDGEEDAGTSSSSSSTSTRPPLSPPTTPPRTPSPPVQQMTPPVLPTRKPRRKQAVMGTVKRSARIGNRLPGPQPRAPVAAPSIPMAVLGPQSAAEVRDTIRERLADYNSGRFIPDLGATLSLGRLLTTAIRLSRCLPPSLKEIRDLESLKDRLARLC